MCGEGAGGAQLAARAIGAPEGCGMAGGGLRDSCVSEGDDATEYRRRLVALVAASAIGTAIGWEPGARHA